MGEPTTFTASWTGLDPAKRWLGVIAYAGDAGGTPVTSDKVTIVSIG